MEDKAEGVEHIGALNGNFSVHCLASEREAGVVGGDVVGDVANQANGGHAMSWDGGHRVVGGIAVSIEGDHRGDAALAHVRNGDEVPPAVIKHMGDVRQALRVFRGFRNDGIAFVFVASEGANKMLAGTHGQVAAVGADALERKRDGDHHVHFVAQFSNLRVVDHGRKVKIQIRGLRQDRVTGLEDLNRPSAQNLRVGRVRGWLSASRRASKQTIVIGQIVRNTTRYAGGLIEISTVVVPGDVILDAGIAESPVIIAGFFADDPGTGGVVVDMLPPVFVESTRHGSIIGLSAEEVDAFANHIADDVVVVRTVRIAAKQRIGGGVSAGAEIAKQAQVAVGPVNTVANDFDFKDVVLTRQKLGLQNAVTNGEQVVGGSVLAIAHIAPPGGGGCGKARAVPGAVKASGLDRRAGIAGEEQSGVAVKGIPEAGDRGAELIGLGFAIAIVDPECGRILVLADQADAGGVGVNGTIVQVFIDQLAS